MAPVCLTQFLVTLCLNSLRPPCLVPECSVFRPLKPQPQCVRLFLKAGCSSKSSDLLLSKVLFLASFVFRFLVLRFPMIGQVLSFLFDIFNRLFPRTEWFFLLYSDKAFSSLRATFCSLALAFYLLEFLCSVINMKIIIDSKECHSLFDLSLWLRGDREKQ